MVCERRSRTAAAVSAICVGLAAQANGQSCIWTAREIQGLPPGQMLYHGGLQRVLLVGGGAIWSWNGINWTSIHSGGIGPPNAAAVAYDSARDRIVAFGGFAAGSYLGEMWEWDGTAWMNIPAPGPAARVTRLVYDQPRGRTVLFGGANASPGLLDDTWEWDGQVWTLAATSGPGPLFGHMAFDSVRGRTMFFGRETYANAPQLWEWDGSTWVVRPTVGPVEPAQWMVFDPGRSRMILATYDGHNAPYFATWELDTQTAQWDLRTPGTAPTGPAAFDVARSRGIVRWNSATWEYNPAASMIHPYIIEHPVGDDYPFGAIAQLSVEAGGTAIEYQWRRNFVPIVDGGSISGATTATLTINPMRREYTGYYDVVISNTCATIVSEPTVLGPAWICYPNCDDNSSEPILNVDDFTCFINTFAYAQALPYEYQVMHYANCDGSTIAPVLNVDDFTCFINAFAAGCP